jgi:hypothetical protein
MCESRSLIVRGNLRSDITRRAALWEAANVEPREIRLKSVRAPDFAGAAISSHLWEWRHRWNVHYESAGADLIQFASLLLLHSPIRPCSHRNDSIRFLLVLLQIYLNLGVGAWSIVQEAARSVHVQTSHQ